MPLAELTAFGPVSAGWAALPPDQADGPRPVIVQCHERYGLVRHTVELAERFATEGFVTVAPDFYADVGLTGEEQRLPTSQTTSCGSSTPRSATLGPCWRAAGLTRGRRGVCRSGSRLILASAERDVVPTAVML